MPPIEQLLLPHLSWLERNCQRRAATRPGLEADDLFHEVVARFIERAPRWFAQPPKVSLEAQARTLLKNLLLHQTTDWEREAARRPRETAEEADAPPLVEQLAALTPLAEEHLQAAQEQSAVADAVAALSNPVYRLLLLCAYLPDRLTQADIEAVHRQGSGSPLARSPEEVWRLLVQARRSRPDDEAAWKATIAVILRTDGPADAPASPTTQGWLSRTLHRARVALAEALS